MKNSLKKVAAFVRQTWVWTLALLLTLALLVWWVGPLLAVNDYKFWADASARLLSISALCLLWGLMMVFVSWRAGIRKKEREDSEVGKARELKDAQLETSQKVLRQRFKEALRTLTTSSVYRGRLRHRAFHHIRRRI